MVRRASVVCGRLHWYLVRCVCVASRFRKPNKVIHCKSALKIRSKPRRPRTGWVLLLILRRLHTRRSGRTLFQLRDKGQQSSTRCGFSSLYLFVLFLAKTVGSASVWSWRSKRSGTRLIAAQIWLFWTPDCSFCTHTHGGALCTRMSKA